MAMPFFFISLEINNFCLVILVKKIIFTIPFLILTKSVFFDISIKVVS